MSYRYHVCISTMPCLLQFYEAKFESSGDIDDFVAALPVKEMVDLTHTVMSRELSDAPRTTEEEANIHNYVWMLRWLETSMEISEVSFNLYVKLDVIDKNFCILDLTVGFQGANAILQRNYTWIS